MATAIISFLRKQAILLKQKFGRARFSSLASLFFRLLLFCSLFFFLRRKHKKNAFDGFCLTKTDRYTVQLV